MASAAPLFYFGGNMQAFLKFLLTEPDANSRFVFLLQGIATAISIQILTVAYVMAHDPSARDGFATTLMVLLGGGSLANLAKGYSKRVSSGDAGCSTPPDKG